MYQERASSLPYVTAWWRVSGRQGKRILPDGCLDLIWHDGAVVVAGPDTTAQFSVAAPGSRFFGLRFACGTGPGVVGVPASELIDRHVPLADLWPGAAVRPLAEAGDPLAALESAARARWRPPDRAMVALAVAARAGAPVGVTADALGLSPRQLQRRSNGAFGYGPKTLARVFRLQRAIRLARGGTSFAAVSATAGYADQAHLARDVRAMAGVPLVDLISAT